MQDLLAAGLKVVATRGTAAALASAGIEVESVYKVNEGRPNIVDLIKTGKVNLVINTPLGRESFYDEKSIRRAAIRYNIPCITTLSAASAAARGIRAMAWPATPWTSPHCRICTAAKMPPLPRAIQSPLPPPQRRTRPPEVKYSDESSRNFSAAHHAFRRRRHDRARTDCATISPATIAIAPRGIRPQRLHERIGPAPLGRSLSPLGDRQGSRRARQDL